MRFCIFTGENLFDSTRGVLYAGSDDLSEALALAEEAREEGESRIYIEDREGGLTLPFLKSGSD